MHGKEEKIIAKTNKKVAAPEAETTAKLQAVDLAIAQIEKQFGQGAIMKMDEGLKMATIPVVSTGSLALNLALGVGGFPKGRIVEIYGPEASGKTTLCLHAIADVQKKGSKIGRAHV